MIVLNYHDPRPLYAQLKERLRREILSGALQAGEQLPSVRELAASLAINPNTIRRAYLELETEGYVCTVQGKGSFVSALTEVKDTRREELLTRFSETAAELLRLGEMPERLAELLKKEAQPCSR